MFTGKKKGPEKTKSVMHPVKCTLEELYVGKLTRIKINRDVVCKSCKGMGGEQGANQKCDICVGTGKIVRSMMVGIG